MDSYRDEGFPTGKREKVALWLWNAHIPGGCQFCLQNDPFIPFQPLERLFANLGVGILGEAWFELLLSLMAVEKGIGEMEKWNIWKLLVELCLLTLHLDTWERQMAACALPNRLCAATKDCARRSSVLGVALPPALYPVLYPFLKGRKKICITNC